MLYLLKNFKKKFLKGIKNYGKNFFSIKSELIPHKETSDIVEYYYLWKKTPAAAMYTIPRRRYRPIPTVKKNNSNNNTNISNSNNNGKSNKKSNNTNSNEFSGGSDIDSNSNDSDESSDTKQAPSSMTCCTNCYTTGIFFTYYIIIWR